MAYYNKSVEVLRQVADSLERDSSYFAKDDYVVAKPVETYSAAGPSSNPLYDRLCEEVRDLRNRIIYLEAQNSGYNDLKRKIDDLAKLKKKPKPKPTITYVSETDEDNENTELESVHEDFNKCEICYSFNPSQVKPYGHSGKHFKPKEGYCKICFENTGTKIPEHKGSHFMKEDTKDILSYSGDDLCLMCLAMSMRRQNNHRPRCFKYNMRENRGKYMNYLKKQQYDLKRKRKLERLSRDNQTLNATTGTTTTTWHT